MSFKLVDDDDDDDCGDEDDNDILEILHPWNKMTCPVVRVVPNVYGAGPLVGAKVIAK
jgi:hypothetical protein